MSNELLLLGALLSGLLVAQVFVSGGTTSQGDTPAESGAVLSATVALTSQQFKSLLATPVEIVAAPGAGKLIVPLQMITHLRYGGVSTFTWSDQGEALGLVYDGLDTGQSIWQGSIGSDFATAQDEVWVQTYASADPYGILTAYAETSVAVNAALKLTNIGAAEFGGNAENDNVVAVTVLYTVIDFTPGAQPVEG
jgi:hypothetical protein